MIPLDALRRLVLDGSVRAGPMPEIPSGLPSGWGPILRAADPWPEVLRLWSPFRGRMGRTVFVMSDRLQGVGLRTPVDGAPALLYFFQKGEKLICYEGNVPGAAPPHVPKDVGEFYETLHDGWALINGRSEGLLSAAEAYRLSSVLTDPPERAAVDPNNLMIVSELLGGISLLGFDVARQPSPCWRWRKELPPELVADFWGAIDRDVAGYLGQLDRGR